MPCLMARVLSRSPPTGFVDPAAEPVKIVRIGRGRARRGGALK